MTHSPPSSPMESANAPRGYSDFFASGLRAVTKRARRASFTRKSIDVVQTSASYWTDRYPDDHNFSRRRHASMDVQNMTLETVQARKRRSALISLSARLFDRASSSSVEDPPTSATPLSERSTKSDGSVRAESTDDDMPMTSDSQSATNSAPNSKASPLLQPIDPFASSDAGSVYADVVLSDKAAASSLAGIRESFLSLNSSSSTRSSLILPHQHERPTSVPTMPLPSRSRPPSLQYRTPNQEKLDFSWITEEEEPSISYAKDHEDWDAPSKIDWHQFHIDLLTDPIKY